MTNNTSPLIQYFRPKEFGRGIHTNDMQPIAYYRKIRESARSPHKVTKGSIGFDLCLTEHTTFPPFRITKVDLGIILYPPPHSYFQLVAKSGLALYQGLIVVGGVIDPDYRGEVSALIQNIGNKKQHLTKGTPIAQAINKTAIPPVMKLWPADTPVPTTERGEKGFGQCTKLYNANFSYLGRDGSPTDFTSDPKLKGIVITPRPINSQQLHSLCRARSETPVGTVQPFTTKNPRTIVKSKSEDDVTGPQRVKKGITSQPHTTSTFHSGPRVTVTLSKSPAGRHDQSGKLRTPTLSHKGELNNSAASPRVQYKNYELTPDGKVTKTTCPPPRLPLSMGYEASRLEVSTTSAQTGTLHVSTASVFRQPPQRPTVTEQAMIAEEAETSNFPYGQPPSPSSTDVGVPIVPSFRALLGETPIVSGGEKLPQCDLVASHAPYMGTGEINADPTRDAEEGLQALKDLGCDMTPHHMFEDPWGEGSMIFSLEQYL